MYIYIYVSTHTHERTLKVAWKEKLPYRASGETTPNLWAPPGWPCPGRPGPLGSARFGGVRGAEGEATAWGGPCRVGGKKNTPGDLVGGDFFGVKKTLF